MKKQRKEETKKLIESQKTRGTNNFRLQNVTRNVGPFTSIWSGLLVQYEPNRASLARSATYHPTDPGPIPRCPPFHLFLWLQCTLMGRPIRAIICALDVDEEHRILEDPRSPISQLQNDSRRRGDQNFSSCGGGCYSPSWGNPALETRDFIFIFRQTRDKGYHQTNKVNALSGGGIASS